ncbi:MAG: glycosyl hydrolase [Crocinitomicaceae bacterium]|nr:glycosyl hydrolase [Crocinitomicaceae bacterium]
MKNILLAAFIFAGLNSVIAQKKDKEKETKSGIESSTVSGLKFRLVGPALTCGRVADLAIDPNNHHIWYVAAASGGVWKTTNHGTTFSPIFDSYGSYSIGCIALAPSNSNTVWVGTGENNNQRSVAYGDGIYKSLDGGKSFKNMGLKTSEHIGKIIIHPTNENIVWVAAYGPVWSKGGERGVYKTTDGGKTWKRTLEISEHTGIAEISIDPSNADILYASAHQRRRREWTYIGGGPESGLYKSTDGGETWREINSGLPKGEMGRIGIAVSPVDPNYVYAIVEARGDKAGFFRSTNKGESWSKMSGYKTSGNYYQEIICDLTNKDKVFSMNTWLHHTENGGKDFIKTGESKKHVDNHCIWIDPNDANHWIVGCDGGLYETYNHAEQWKYYSNLPIIQFYKVATDNASPFYNIYGGTQDNNSMGGPSATINNAGILNSDWFITNGGDGFESAIDPLNPNISYAQAQYGWLVRYDKSSGEKTPIQPMPGKGELAYRWNWDSPLLISPHDNKTLYFCANKVFKSTNRGDDWTTVSPDLSQQMDRNKLPVMDQVWSIDAVMKNKSTTIYGNIVAFDESAITKGLLYVGTDDGLVQSSTNGGDSWRKVGTFSGVPANTRVNMITASLHDENVVFTVFNNHRSGDFKPYVMKSSDKGKTWEPIAGDLPERGSVFAFRQDHIDPNLLFVGTEFGCYFSNNAGKNWTKLTGLPTIAVYDIDLQKRESDIVVATFGRGFYVLDNYAPLRSISKVNLDKPVYLFPIKDALQYVPSAPLGLRGTGSQGANLWHAENPKFGATFSLYIKETESRLKQKRIKKQKEQEKNKEAVPYPTFDALRAEANEDKKQLIWIIRDSNGKEVKRLKTSPSKGISRINWDLRMEITSPVKINKSKPGRYSSPDVGFLVAPGKYSVEIISIKDGVMEQLVQKTSFNVIGLNNQTLIASNNNELTQFRKAVAETKRSLDGASKIVGETSEKIKLLEHAIKTYPNTDLNLLLEMEALKTKLDGCKVMLWGDGIKSSHEFETEPSISGRIGIVHYQLFSNTTGVTQTQRDNKAIAEEEYAAFRVILDDVIVRVKAVEKKLEAASMPYIKGKDENWKED